MTTNVSDHIALVAVELRSWGGTVSVDERNLPQDLNRLPKALAKAEEIRLIPPERLKGYDTFRKSIERYLDKLGIPLFGLRAIPVQDLVQVHADLDARAAEFQSNIRAPIAAKLPDWYAQQEAAFPEYQELLRASQVEPAKIIERFQFRYRSLKVAAPSSDPNDPASQSYLAELGEALGTLLRTVADRADALWIESFRGKSEIQQATLKPVKALIQKLRGFAMIDLRLMSTVKALESAIAGLPASGRLSAGETTMVAGIVRLLADPAKLIDHGNAAFTAVQTQPAQAALQLASPQAPRVIATPAANIPAPTLNAVPSAELKVMFRRAAR